jgi:site-specific DNA-cytosine methylase
MTDAAISGASSEESCPVTYGSLFSGVGGFDLGCDAAGWDCRWQVEWDEKCRTVLANHWPNVARHEDVRDVVGGLGLPQLGDRRHDSAPAAHELGAGDRVGLPVLEPVDIITFGFPCQDLSVAGKRAGLDGERSGLFFEAVRIIREMREATNGLYPRVAVAENVVGLLNADGGSAMERCLEALAEVGAVALEWRVLDAQFFGVPRRVFLVAVFDPRAAGRGQVFPEPEGVFGDPAASDEAGQAVAGTLGGGSGSRGWSPDTDRMTFVPDGTGTLPSRGDAGYARDADTQGFIFTDDAPTTLAVAMNQRDEVRLSEVHPALVQPGGRPGHGTPTILQTYVKAGRARSKDDAETWKADGPAPTLNVFDNGGDTRATILAVPAEGLPETTGTLTTAFGAKNYGNIQEVLSGSIIPTQQPTAGTPTDGIVGALTTRMMAYGSPEVDGNHYLPAPMPELPKTTGTVLASWSHGAGNAQVEEGFCIPAHRTDSETAHADGTSTASGGQTYAFQPDDNRGEAPGALRAVEASVAPTIGCGDHHSDRGLRILSPAEPTASQIAPTLTASNDPSRSPQSSEVTQQVAAVNAAGLGVRRLTPRECERLMGWPDDHTRYAADGKEIADSHRYKMCGNGVAAPVAKYIAVCVTRILG